MEAGKDEAQPVGKDDEDWKVVTRTLAPYAKLLGPGGFNTWKSFLGDKKPFATEIIGLFLHHLAYITNPRIKEFNDFASFNKIVVYYTGLSRLPTIPRNELKAVEIKRQYKLLQDLTKAFLRDTFNVNNIERVNIPKEAQMLWNVKVANAAENVLRESFPEQWLQLQFGREFAKINQAANEARARMPPSKNSTTAQLRKQSEEALNSNPTLSIGSFEEGEIDLEPAATLADMSSNIPLSELYTERGD